MDQCITCGKEIVIIAERPPLCHGCLARDARRARARPQAALWTADGGAATPPRPPRVGGLATCRGCFNRCRLAPGQAGVCGVKRNIGGRITGHRLRIKGIAGGR